MDYVHLDGRDIGVRWPLNTTPVRGGARRYADLGLNPANPTMNMSIGSGRFDGVNFGIRRNMDHGIQLNAWYSLSKAVGRGGQAIDELTTNLVQDATQPLADVQLGPSARADARHKVTVSAIIQAPWGVTVSPIFRYRSATPIHIWYGYDNNGDSVSNDLFPTAYRFKDIDDAGVPSFEEIGPCETVNCGRGAPLSQLNLRVAKAIRIRTGMNVELFGEVFNLFNEINPAFNVGAATAGARFTGSFTSPTPNA